MANRHRELVRTLLRHDEVERGLMRRRARQGAWARWWEGQRQALLLLLTGLILPSWLEHNALEVQLIAQFERLTPAQIRQAVKAYERQAERTWEWWER